MGWLIAFRFILGLGIGGDYPNTTTFVYPAEIFPVDVRTTAHGLAAAAGKLGAFFGTFALPMLLDRFHIQGAQLSVAAVCLAGFLVSFLLPESKGRTLEDLTREAGWDDARAAENSPAADTRQPAHASGRMG